MKTSELTPPYLDLAVAKVAGIRVEYAGGNVYYYESPGKVFRPSAIWEQGGKIIEGMGMDVTHHTTHWMAHLWANRNHKQTNPSAPGHEKVRILQSAVGYGPTLLIAAMRCYVASQLGDEFEPNDDDLAQFKREHDALEAAYALAKQEEI